MSRIIAFIVTGSSRCQQSNCSGVTRALEIDCYGTTQGDIMDIRRDHERF